MVYRILTVACLTITSAIACDYAYTTPGQRLQTSTAVFVGAALERGPKGYFRDPISFRVEESFKSVRVGSTIVINPGSGDCATVFQPGIKYVVFASQWTRQSLPVAGLSSGSIAVPQSAAELRWLRGRARPDWKPSVLGLINDVYSALPGSPWRPLVGAEVRLMRDGATVSAMSDASGVFEFDGLNRGEYTVQASLPGYQLRFEPRTVRIGEACEFPNLSMSVDGRIAGQVQRASGAAAVGIEVELTAKRQTREYEPPFERAKTTEEGLFLFRGIPPGEYMVSVNGFAKPTPNQPYPKASVDVSIGKNEKLNGLSIHLAAPLPTRRITVRILMPDGSPSPEASVTITHESGYTVPLTLHTDHRGEATFDWMQNAPCRIYAAARDGSNAAATVSAAQTALELRLNPYKR